MNSDEIIKANIEVHSKLAKDYTSSEPHFRPENIAKVTKIFKDFTNGKPKNKALDLGCGTGFMVNILKTLYPEVTGVDVTQAMLDQIDKSGKSKITLFCEDTGKFKAEKGAFDVVSMYSFIHHLFDVVPTFTTAANALRSGGQLFIGLEPNFYFWESVSQLQGAGTYDEIVAREIRALHEEETIAQGLGVKKETLEKAEYSKALKGGFKEGELRKILVDLGFKNIRVEYDWFLGEAAMINEAGVAKEVRFANAAAVDKLLKRQLPLSRHLFKYLFLFAEK